MKLTIARFALILSTALGACAKPEGAPAEREMTRDEAVRVLQAVESGYAIVGKQDVFDRLMSSHDVAMSKCKERYLVEFSPKGFQGFDGGIQVTVDVETLRINDSYYLPGDCGPYFHVNERNQM